jgi:hypothetical protein
MKCVYCGCRIDSDRELLIDVSSGVAYALCPRCLNEIFLEEH